MTSLESKLIAQIQQVIREREATEERIREIERRLLKPRSVVELGKMKLYLN